MSIDWVTFDLDDTLWAVGPVIVRAEQQFYQWLQQHCPRITQHYDEQGLAAHRREFVNQLPELAHDLTTSRTRWIGQILASFGYREPSAEQAFRVFWEHRNAVQLFDEVAPTMERLTQQYRLGVITNGNACVEHIGIDHWFEFVVSSEAAGHAKPAPQIFHAALAKADVVPSRIVHVGDDPTNDVIGAAAMGMRTIWYNPRSLPWPGGVGSGGPESGGLESGRNRPDAQIRDMSQLHQALMHIDKQMT